MRGMQAIQRWRRAAAVLAGACVLSAAVEGADLKIVASFYPIYIATLNVAGSVPGVEVVNLTKPFTGCPHDYSLTTEDMVTLSRADVFVANGAGLETFLAKAVRQRKGIRLIEASEGVALIRRDGEANPHVWLSVTRHMRQVENIAGGLAKADPAHAEAYRLNADAYVRKLGDLRVEIENGLKTASRRDIVTFHDAFPYFAEEFGLRVATVIARDPGSEPTAREMAETIAVIRRVGAGTVLTEPQYPAKSAESIARETGATVAVLDPVVTGPPDADAYLDAMRRNLATLRKVLK